MHGKGEGGAETGTGAGRERTVGVASILASLGIVFGDLGTSPLYTFQTLIASVGGRADRADALGLLSLVAWALLLTISVKYCLVVMRADNDGEGGILALLSLVKQRKPGRSALLVAMGVFGAALIYGDGAITPAISVLSAIEGLTVVTDTLQPYVLPIALCILVALFAAQPFGTAKIGRVFGPVMLLWFVTIGAIGLTGVMRQPAVLAALDPLQALGFIGRHGWASLVTLGGVVLAVTGGEALYADMGHIGRAPIRSAWYVIVLPALLLNYAGQTALLLQTPDLKGNPFFQLVPGWGLVPMVVLATAATIIASQAIITGAFSLTRQAMQLGYFPGLSIRQTSDQEYGQIYVPVVNWIMMAATLALAAAFGSSERLASAFGLAVSLTMLLTTLLLYRAMAELWRWPAWAALGTFVLFALIDAAFALANSLKLPEGGWVALLMGSVVYVVMTTWHAGVTAVHRQSRSIAKTPAEWLGWLRENPVPRVPGTAVFFSRELELLPPVLVRHVQQFKALHETVVDLTVQFAPVPRIGPERRSEVHEVGDGTWQVLVRFGFMEVPNLQAALNSAKAKGCPLRLDDAIYIAARDAVAREEKRPHLTRWRRMLFAFLSRNAVRTPDRFALPPERFVEVARQVEL